MPRQNKFEIIAGTVKYLVNYFIMDPLVFEDVNRNTHVPRLLRTRVDIAVILWQQVHVVEDEASEIFQSQRLFVADIHQHGPVESTHIGLLDNKNAVFYLLPLEQRMQVGQQHTQMHGPRSVRHNNGNCLFGQAAGRFAESTWL